MNHFTTFQLVGRVAALLTLIASAHGARAHDGRRFDVQVVANQLVAQGRNTGPDDGLPSLRPYVNSIHDHWRNVPSLGIATTVAPEFDIRQAVGQLVGYEVTLDWIDARRWVDPPMMPDPMMPIVLEPLAPGEVISIVDDFHTVTSNTFGELTLHPSVPTGGAVDLSFVYALNHLPGREIHVLTFQMKATPTQAGLPPLLPSDPLHILLSPEGQLHHHALFLEQAIHTNVVPEPTSAIVLAIAGAFLLLRRAGPVRAVVRRPT